MNYAETAELLFMLQANYPNTYAKMEEKSVKALIATWVTAFKDYRKDIMTKALIRAMLTKKDYPPTIADVAEDLAILAFPSFSTLDGGQAWVKAVEIALEAELRGVVPDAKAEFARSDAVIADAKAKYPLVWNVIAGVGGPDEFLEANTALRAQFIRLYNSCRQDELRRLVFPDELKTQRERMPNSNTPRLPTCGQGCGDHA